MGKSLSSKIKVYGFFFAIVALALSSFGCYWCYEQEPIQTQEQGASVVILNYSIVGEEGKGYVKGEVENQGEKIAKSVNVKIDFYNEDNEIVKSTSGLIEGTDLEAGKKASFRIEAPTSLDYAYYEPNVFWE